MCVPSFLPPGTCLATLRTAITLIEDARWGPQKAHPRFSPPGSRPASFSRPHLDLCCALLDCD